MFTMPFNKFKLVGFISIKIFIGSIVIIIETFFKKIIIAHVKILSKCAKTLKKKKLFL